MNQSSLESPMEASAELNQTNPPLLRINPVLETPFGNASSAAQASTSSATAPASFVDPYAWSTSLNSEEEAPLLTSSACSESLAALFTDLPILAVATEASSHPAGLQALYAQPYIYAGGGLGNLDECPLQTCLAGAGTRRDSLTFGSVCVPAACSAYDLAARDFAATLSRMQSASSSSSLEETPAVDALAHAELQELARDYVTLHERLAEINQFLQTGWTCGDFKVPFDAWPFGIPYVVVLTTFLALSLTGTLRRRQRGQGNFVSVSAQTPVKAACGDEEEELAEVFTSTPSTVSSQSLTTASPSDVDDQVEDEAETRSLLHTPAQSGGAAAFSKASSMIPRALLQRAAAPSPSSNATSSVLSCFDATVHLRRLIQQHAPETAVLDGLRVGSLLWIVLGHVLSIESSSGAGYSNPSHFLPPHGFTTTWAGQLLFSSRLAVDTFLVISGFLVVHVLRRRLPVVDSSRHVWWTYLRHLPTLFVGRWMRLVPLYAAVLGFFTQIAPHLGGGPFWWEWIGLLKPCQDSAWANLLFVNNFVPWDLPTTDTCFYHGWYLAVDMQLFLVAPLFVLLYRVNPTKGWMMTLLFWALSVVMTCYLAYTREWSINTFDGAAVARYDVEAYAKPHTRVQSYLVGMFVAMMLPDAVLRQRSQWTWKHAVTAVLSLACMAAVAFGTVTGAYARRPCQYQEWPAHDHCGSLWSPARTFWYTALSRTVWTVSIGCLLHVCLGRRDNWISSVLSWPCWTPLSQLSFGVYLTHPVVIFIWKLGDREKQVFRLLTFGMNYIAVCVVSFVLALLAALVVEFPCAVLWKRVTAIRNDFRPPSNNKEIRKPVIEACGYEYGAIEASDRYLSPRR